VFRHAFAHILCANVECALCVGVCVYRCACCVRVCVCGCSQPCHDIEEKGVDSHLNRTMNLHPYTKGGLKTYLYIKKHILYFTIESCR